MIPAQRLLLLVLMAHRDAAASRSARTCQAIRAEPPESLDVLVLRADGWYVDHNDPASRPTAVWGNSLPRGRAHGTGDDPQGQATISRAYTLPWP